MKKINKIVAKYTCTINIGKDGKVTGENIESMEQDNNTLTICGESTVISITQNSNTNHFSLNNIKSNGSIEIVQNAHGTTINGENVITSKKNYLLFQTYNMRTSKYSEYQVWLLGTFMIYKNKTIFEALANKQLLPKIYLDQNEIDNILMHGNTILNIDSDFISSESLNVDINGNTELDISGSKHVKKAIIVTSGSAKYDASLKIDNIECTSSGNSELAIGGNTQVNDAKIITSGNAKFDANLIFKNIICIASGNSDIKFGKYSMSGEFKSSGNATIDGYCFGKNYRQIIKSTGNSDIKIKEVK